MEGCTLLTPKERELRARLAAHTKHSKYDPKETTKKPRAALLAKIEAEVDPNRTLPPEERERRVEQARKAYFTGLALKASKARRAKATKPNNVKEKPPIQAAGGEV